MSSVARLPLRPQLPRNRGYSAGENIRNCLELVRRPSLGRTRQSLGPPGVEQFDNIGLGCSTQLVLQWTVDHGAGRASVLELCLSRQQALDLARELQVWAAATPD